MKGFFDLFWIASKSLNSTSEPVQEQQATEVLIINMLNIDNSEPCSSLGKCKELLSNYKWVHYILSPLHTAVWWLQRSVHHPPLASLPPHNPQDNINHHGLVTILQIVRLQCRSCSKSSVARLHQDYSFLYWAFPTFESCKHPQP